MDTPHVVTSRRRKLRRYLGAGFALLLLATGCGDDDGTSASAGLEADGTETVAADSDDLTTIQVGLTGKVVQYGHLAVAEKEGFFKDHGLAIEYVETGAGPETMAALISGSVNVSGSGVSLMWPTLSEGERVISLFGGQRLNYSLIVQPDAQLPNAGKEFPQPLQDIAGMTVGVTARGAITEQFVVRMLEEAGMSADDVTFVATGAPPSSLVAFQEGQVDAFVTFPPVKVQLGEEGKDYITVADASAGSTGSLFDDFVINTITANGGFIDKNPDLILDFCTAMRDAYHFSLEDANEERMGEILGEFVGLDATSAAKVWQQHKNTFVPVISPELWAAQAKYAREDLQDFVPDYEEYVYQPCQELDWK